MAREQGAALLAEADAGAGAADQVEREQGQKRVLVHCMTGITKCAPVHKPWRVLRLPAVPWWT